MNVWDLVATLAGVMSPLDWALTSSGVLCVALTVRQNVWNWPIGMVNSAVFLVVTVQHKLYADGGLQVLYLVLGAYGLWHWLYGNPAERDALPVTRAPIVEAIVACAVAAVLFLGLGVLLGHVTDTDVPFYDAFPTATSLLAQYLLTRKYLLNWPVWILLVNVPYLALYLYKDIRPLAVLQPVYVGLSVWGWVDWRRSLGVDPVGDPAVEPAVAGGA